MIFISYKINMGNNISCCREDKEEEPLIVHKKNNKIYEELKEKMNFKRRLPNPKISHVPIKPTNHP